MTTPDKIHKALHKVDAEVVEVYPVLPGSATALRQPSCLSPGPCSYRTAEVECISICSDFLVLYMQVQSRSSACTSSSACACLCQRRFQVSLVLCHINTAVGGEVGSLPACLNFAPIYTCKWSSCHIISISNKLNWSHQRSQGIVLKILAGFIVGVLAGVSGKGVQQAGQSTDLSNTSSYR